MRKPFSYFMLVLVCGCLGLFTQFFIGCTESDIAALRGQLDQRQADLVLMQDQVASLKALAASTGNASFIDAAAKAEKTLKIATEEIPKLQKQLDNVKAEPWWNVAIAMAWPFVVPALKLIPGPGGAIATAIAELAYRMNATKSARKEDDAAHALLEKSTTNAPAPT